MQKVDGIEHVEVDICFQMSFVYNCLEIDSVDDYEVKDKSSKDIV